MPGSRLEIYTRLYFERKFGVPFPNVRPDWLQNDESGRNLELDGLNEVYGLAFEVQGRQHYEHVPTFQATVADFQKQVKHDLRKQLVCARRGIRLVIVPPLRDEEEVRKYLDLQFMVPSDLGVERLSMGFDLLTVTDKPRRKSRRASVESNDMVIIKRETAPRKRTARRSVNFGDAPKRSLCVIS